MAKQPSTDDHGKKAHELLSVAYKKLKGSTTLECDVALEVTDAPANQTRRYSFAIGTMRYHFRIKGDTRVHWKEVWEGKGEVPTREAWYEGAKLYVRSSKQPKKLIPIDVGESEGACIKGSLLEGGVLGWRLAHAFDDEEEGGGFVSIFEVKGIREEKLGDRSAVVIDVSIGFGFGPQRPRRPSGTSRVWIDKESHLLLKREISVDVGTEEKPAKLRALETYTNWKFNEPMTNASFHVEGMRPTDPLADAPADPELFEVYQTRKFLGFDVKPFPAPQGTRQFDDIAKNVRPLAFDVFSRDLSGPEPKPSYHGRQSVIIKTKDGSEIEAYRGYDDKEKILPGHGFASTRVNRRHLYGGGSYHPEDVYIGKRVNGKVQASLFFRDIGSHDTAPHSFAVDGKGQCHLAVADVDMGQNNRFKLYWLIGDLKTGKWHEAWLIDYRPKFCSWAHPFLAAWKDEVHLIWDWVDATFDGKADSGVFHVRWTPDGFGKKQRIFKGSTRGIGLAVDPDSGRLVVAVGSDKGVMILSKSATGDWSTPTPLHSELTKNHDVSIHTEKGRFVVRTTNPAKEWVLTVKD